MYEISDNKDSATQNPSLLIPLTLYNLHNYFVLFFAITNALFYVTQKTYTLQIFTWVVK